MRLLVTGAGGQLGHDVVAAADAAGDDVVGLGHAELDVTDRDAVLGGDHDVAARRRRALRGVDRGRRVRGRSRDGRSRPTPSPCAGSPRRAIGPAPTSCTCRRTTSSTASQRPPVPRVGRDDPAVGVRRLEARRRARGAGPRRPRRGRADVVGVRGARLEHGAHRAAAGRRARRPARRAGVRRRPARPPDVHRRPRSAAAPAGARSALRGHPRHQPGRGHVVRVRRAGARRRPATTGRWCARSRPPSSTRHARRRARRTACSTTPCCAASGFPLLRDFREPLAELVRRLR